MRRLTALLLMFMSALGLSLLFTQQVFAVPETVTVKQAYVLDGENQTELTELQVAPGATFEPATDPGEGYEFAYYIVNGLISDKAEGEAFTVGSYLNLVAVYTPVDKFAVVFVDVNGEIIQHNNKLAQYVSSGEDAVAPTVLPTKKNYKVSETDPWSDSFNNVTENKVITLQYELDTDATFTISLNGVDQTANYNDIVTLTSDNDVLWKDNDQVVWYGSTYRFSALSDRTLTTEAGDAPTEPIVSMQEILDLRAGHRSYLAQVYAPNNDLLEVGFLRGSEHEVTFDNMSANFASALIPLTNEFIVSVPNSVEDNIRAYALSGDPLLASYSYVEPIVELVKLPTPNTEGKDLNELNTPTPWFDMGGEYGNPDGYSGKMRIYYVSEGYPTLSHEVNFSSGRLNIPKSFWDNLIKGVTYNVKVQAIGNGTTHTDSEIANTLATVLVPLPKLNAPILYLNDNDITWSSVDHAEYYELYIDDKFVATIDGLSFTIVPKDLELSYGTHIIKVVAYAEGYTESSSSITYEYENVEAIKLNSPINLNIEEGILTWDEVPNANGYIVYVDDKSYIVEVGSTFDLNVLELYIGSYSITVVAKGDSINYTNSNPSNTIEFGGTITLPRLNPITVDDFGGPMPGHLLNGHGNNGVFNGYMREIVLKSADLFGQEGFKQSNGIRFQIFDGDTPVTEYFYATHDGAGVAINTLNPSYNSIFASLTQREEPYKIHVVLVAEEGSGFANSLPLIHDFYWKEP